MYAFSFVLANLGIAMAAKMPMITTTISSSIRVKPLRFICFLLVKTVRVCGWDVVRLRPLRGKHRASRGRLWRKLLHDRILRGKVAMGLALPCPARCRFLQVDWLPARAG